MYLSKRCTYGLRALLELKTVLPEGQLTSREISMRTNISKKFLDQLLMDMNKNGIVKSTKGSRGGYALNLPPDKIHLAQAVEALSGPISVADCLSQEWPCTRKPACPVHSLAFKLKSQILKFLNNQTLEDLSKMGTGKDAFTYNI